MKHRLLFIVCLCLAQSALAQRTTQNLATLSGSVKDDEIIVQGDNREKIKQWLNKNGYPTA